MRLKGSRLFWILDALLLGGALVFSAYKVATRVQPIGWDEQAPYRKKIDPQVQILEYYRQYPERYLRISKESWQYLENYHSALHSFTLKNSATVPYTEIEVRFSYETSSGKNLKMEVVKIPGTIAGLGTLDVKGVRVRRVPAASEKVTTSVVKASIAR
jgi:hypothetical protein